MTFALREVILPGSEISQRIRFFVVTGSLAPPLVMLGDNGGLPEVQAVYAHSKTVSGAPGVVIDLVFVRRPDLSSNATFALNLWQPRMLGNLRVVPLPNTP